MKNKKIVNCFAAMVIGVLSVFSSPVLAASLQGGGDIGGAVSIVANSYQVAGLADGESQYFYFTAKPGQETKIGVKFTAAADSDYDTAVDVKMYGANDQELVYKYCWTGESINFSWLQGLGKAEAKYYVRIYNDGPYDAGSFTITMAVNDRYDAGSQTDAGADVNSAMSVKAGEYTGFFSGGDVTNVLGDDFVDFYKLSLKAGDTLKMKMVPAADAEISLAVYDTQRALVNEATPDNAGQIMNLQYAATKDGEVFLKVACSNDYCGDKLASYSLGVGVTSGNGGEMVPPPGDGTGGGTVDYPELPPDGDAGKGNGGTGGEEVVPGNGGTGYDGLYDGGGNFLLDDGTGYPGIGGIPMALIWANLAIFGIILFGGLVFYIYFAICLQKLAKRTGTTPDWLAWIPIGNAFLMLKIAQKPMWWFLLLFVPIINIVAGVIVWMKIAEKVGKESWVVFLMFVPVVGIAMPAYLAFSGDNQKKPEFVPEDKKPEFIGGSKEADKPTVGYKHPCKYCQEMISPDSAVCPFCSKEGPLGPDRCPKCHDPIEKKWKSCAHCGLNLRIVCPFCGKVTFFGGYCEDCGKKMVVNCPYCQFEQPPLGDKCIKCGQPLIKKEDKK